MLQKKICMLGAFAVGKTSLVSRFVHSLFSERYLTTVGVKIDKKTVTVDQRDLALIVWDIHGEDDLQEVRPSYLRGMHGYLLISDGTRPSTLDTAFQLHARAMSEVGPVPSVFVVNKCDLLTQDAVGELLAGRQFPMPTFATSALTGTEVEAAFLALARELLGEPSA